MPELAIFCFETIYDQSLRAVHPLKTKYTSFLLFHSDHIVQISSV